MFCTFCGSQNIPEASQCFNCGYAFQKSDTGEIVQEQPDWENKGHIFNVVSFFITVREVLFSPTNTFRNLKPGKAIFNAFLFGIIGSTIGGMAGTFWQYLINLSGLIPHQNMFYRLFGSTGTFMIMLFLVPIASAFAIFFVSFVLHLFLKILKGSKRGFPVTFKVYAYSHGATALLGIIPVLGSITGFFWLLIVCIKGFKEAHGISGLKATTAVFFPLFLIGIFILFVIIMLIVFGLGFAYFSNFLNWK